MGFIDHLLTSFRCQQHCHHYVTVKNYAVLVQKLHYVLMHYVV